ncbi:MAG: hypothetical protein EOM20_21750, partial [Spartobacteria bacterium]|nr:hypothetical protein [Spartobacteria bacterium]
AYTYNPAGKVVNYGVDWNQWSETAGLPQGRSRLAAVSVDGYIYAMGGEYVSPKTNVYRFDGFTWSEIAGLPQPLYMFSATVYTGTIYTVGGYNNSQNVSNVYVYSGSTWGNAAAAMPVRIHDEGTAAWDDLLYSIAGYSSVAGVNSNMYSYNGTAWSAAQGLPVRRRVMATGVRSDGIYIAGGLNESGVSQTNAYHFDGTNWIEIAGLPFALNSPGSAVLSNDFYVIGGGSATGRVSTVSRFDGMNWTAAPSLPTNVYGLAAATLDGTIYSIGGYGSGYLTNVYRYPAQTELSGAVPSSGSYTGNYQVVISGFNLGNGSDITNVTLCGFAVSNIDSQSATQVVVTAGHATAGLLGHIVVDSISFGRSIQSNAFTYTAPILCILGTNDAIIASGEAASLV